MVKRRSTKQNTKKQKNKATLNCLKFKAQDEGNNIYIYIYMR
jgi:hypothetical protein